jgi:hypothetical protein
MSAVYRILSGPLELPFATSAWTRELTMLLPSARTESPSDQDNVEAEHE